MVKCDSCLNRNGCYDADTSASFTCEHYKRGEVWNGYHGHCVQPQGTFDKIWNDEGGEDDGF